MTTWVQLLVGGQLAERLEKLALVLRLHTRAVVGYADDEAVLAFNFIDVSNYLNFSINLRHEFPRV